MATKAMQFSVFLQLFLVFSLLFHGTCGDRGGWQIGHATFYGGSDASGTMGKLIKHIRVLPHEMILVICVSHVNT